MPGTLLVHDKRVIGGTPRTNPFYTCDGKTLLLYCLQYVRSYAKRQGGLDELQILCHGYYDHPSELDEAYGMSLDMVGGYGWDLCKEGLHLRNINKTETWKGLIKRIVVFSCGAATTLPGFSPSGGVVISMIAQSGSFGFCKLFVRSCASRKVGPLLRTMYLGIDCGGASGFG